jgi:multisubunit Na+/H+ antiporter MnhB subunit
MKLALDVLLAMGVVWLGWQVVAGRTLFRSIVMFVVFGLLMAVVWARLGSADLALAEAAVGAGITGAMLMLTYRRLLLIVPERAEQAQLKKSVAALPVGLLCGALVFSLGWALVGLPAPDDSAGDAALAALADHEVGNPVTGVLLLFRGYDTLLEMAVLLVAWLGVKAVQPVSRPAAPEPHAPVPLLDALLATVIPGTVLVGGYLLHAGGQAPGGAFQAGAVLAAAGVLLALSGRLQPLGEPLMIQRAGLVVGIGVFTALALAPVAWSRPAMSLPGMWAVYAIEGALTIAIGMTLLLLFLGAGGVQRREP